eukprot:TRINITY_DN46645_c0_g1_i1.p1 TRINITY_DN46645_c0_g1~~TRINITY_DN46645_c0_g1_i1.p1  ORF type:complete len:478 (+),score=49.49 TRINITY_DN46645_c0_g1_i1:38-1471(+)
MRFWTFLVIYCAATLSKPIVPHDGMIIKHNTTFVANTYNFPNGIRIGASGITLDLNGAHLEGLNGTNFGIQILHFNDVTVLNGKVSHYFYGVRAEKCNNLRITGLDVSHNWVDPKSNSTWLNINAPPNLGDKQNLGGGMFLLQCTGGLLQGNTASFQENGFDMYWSSGVTLLSNTAKWNSGWGVHLNHCEGVKVQRNVLQHCNRRNGGDSANILLVNGSSHNLIEYNQCQFGGDGFFIGNEHGCPSNFNLIQHNDCSHARDNAFETTFSNGNRFFNNRASYSAYGFWLGYSYNSTVAGNTMLGNGHAIQIDHGQHNTISNNSMTNNNGPAIYLDTDGQIHFPANAYKCLHLPAQRESSHNLISGNTFSNNNNFAVWLINTTFSSVYNNYFGSGKTISADGLTSASTQYNLAHPKRLELGEYNVVGGDYLAGNWYWNYLGTSTKHNGIGQTKVPYANQGKIKGGGDQFPLFIPNSKAP